MSLAQTPTKLSTPVSTLDAHRDDHDLVARLLDDEANAWREFNTLYGSLAWRCINRVTARFQRVVSTDDVKEIYAGFCVQLLANDKAKLRSFSPERGCRLGSWIGLLATHAAYDFLRARRREPRTEEVSEAFALRSGDRDPYELCELRERAAIARGLLHSFSSKDREFMTLYFGEGLEPEAVAEQMGISVKTVYTKKHKIQARLAQLLQRQSPVSAS
jgi:RNA polymerase sigma-70 factor, ECF subfamily